MTLYDLRHSCVDGREDDGCPLTTYFSLPGLDETLLKIHFSHVDIVRVLDEVFLSTEENSEITGLVRYHFAYRVENSHFWNSQSEFYRDLRPDAVHYRFVTGNACLDVITTDEPSFDFVPFADATGASA